MATIESSNDRLSIRARRERKRHNRALKREVRREMQEFCKEHPEIQGAELRAELREHIEQEFEGIDPGMLLIITKMVSELLPLILALFNRE